MNLAGWSEFLFIGLLAFIIIGPKDLPKVLYTCGRFFQSLRRLSNEFMAEFEAIHHLKEIEDSKTSKRKKTVIARRAPDDSKTPS
jgi:sec-independent protein translocase protein TatB